MSANRVRAWSVAALVVVMAASGCSSGGSGGDGDDDAPAEAPATTTLAFPSPSSGPRQPVEGFGTRAYRISTMPLAARCALLAESALQRAQGLMNRTDLAGFDGMLFEFPQDTTGGFWMKDTPLPLSIAWFDANGQFVSATDMAPCLGRSDCPNYNPAGPYRYALEVPQGGLGPLGIRPGALIALGGTCT